MAMTCIVIGVSLITRPNSTERASSGRPNARRRATSRSLGSRTEPSRCHVWAISVTTSMSTMSATSVPLSSVLAGTGAHAGTTDPGQSLPGCLRVDAHVPQVLALLPLNLLRVDAAPAGADVRLEVRVDRVLHPQFVVHDVQQRRVRTEHDGTTTGDGLQHIVAADEREPLDAGQVGAGRDGRQIGDRAEVEQEQIGDDPLVLDVAGDVIGQRPCELPAGDTGRVEVGLLEQLAQSRVLRAFAVLDTAAGNRPRSEER